MNISFVHYIGHVHFPLSQILKTDKPGGFDPGFEISSPVFFGQILIVFIFKVPEIS